MESTGAWWQSIADWLAAAIIFHDLALFPLYALADRLLGIATKRRRHRSGHPRVSARNYVRVPVLGSCLSLLMFFPGIIRQESATYLAATGQTQQPFLGRWLLLTAAMFIVSALIYAIRLAVAHRRSMDVDDRALRGARDVSGVHERPAPTALPL